MKLKYFSVVLSKSAPFSLENKGVSERDPDLAKNVCFHMVFEVPGIWFFGTWDTRFESPGFIPGSK